ncbi:MAG: hypothetical protein EOS71_00475 [Mesorhizobium sp.]|nr:hypothetical protein EOA35_00725 [Mesorhizobium sp. M8A.F.Ca.ET.023.01.1.1]RWC77755.1 MAG: hypothetical protein EOS71_00475 [Mesorhizobium sp.]
MDGLVSARGYELCVLTFGLAGGSPEARVVHENFEYMADALGKDGMIITGGYDKDYADNAAGFLSHAAEAIYGTGLAPEGVDDRELPIPALVALRRSPEGPPEIAYFKIGGATEQEIIAIFRTIAEASTKPGGIQGLPGNVMRPVKEAAVTVWEALELKPEAFGLGIDLKPFIERLFVRLKGQLG